jgi:hypothetical protein
MSPEQERNLMLILHHLLRHFSEHPNYTCDTCEDWRDRVWYDQGIPSEYRPDTASE